jgi:hypothetical protein
LRASPELVRAIGLGLDGPLIEAAKADLRRQLATLCDPAQWNLA